MLIWIVIFLVVSIIAAIFGFTNVSIAAAGVAKVIFFIFVVLLVISIIMHLLGYGSTPLSV